MSSTEWKSFNQHFHRYSGTQVRTSILEVCPWIDLSILIFSLPSWLLYGKHQDVGDPLVPGFLIFSPEPDLIRFRLA